MKKIIFSILVLVSIMLVSSCTINLPYDFETTGRNYKIMFKVEPEDSLLLLNGRLLGEVYEFSTWDSALNLASKNNELVIKREGYIEEAIDLYDYSEREIVVEVNLKRERTYERKKYIVQKKELKNNDKSSGIGVKPKNINKNIKETKAFKKTTVSLVIKPTESTIYLNKKFWGIVPESGKIGNMVLKKGEYTIDIVKPGYKSFSKTIRIKGNKDTMTMKIVLEKK